MCYFRLLKDTQYNFTRTKYIRTTIKKLFRVIPWLNSIYVKKVVNDIKKSQRIFKLKGSINAKGWLSGFRITFTLASPYSIQ